jgi:hypothetical protein
MKKLKIYNWYTTRVADVMTEVVGGDFLKVVRKTTEGGLRIVAPGTITLGDFVPAVDPLDVLDHGNELRLYRDSKLILQMMDDPTTDVTYPPLKTSRREIDVRRNDGSHIFQLIEYSVPIMEAITSDDGTDNISRFNFLCFADSHAVPSSNHL